MIRTNKIINKLFFPRILLTVILSVAMLGLGVNAISNTVRNTNAVTSQDRRLLVFIVLILFVSGFNTCNEYKKSEKFAALVASKYVKASMKNMPEMKIFQEALQNPKAMKTIANFIFNSLTNSEQRMVKDVVSKTLANINYCDTSYLTDEKISVINEKLLTKAYADILKVIQEHASVHPEFLPEIYKLMAYTDMTYIPHQRTR